jgi:nucleoside-diphosphate-sugar epimerase
MNTVAMAPVYSRAVRYFVTGGTGFVGGHLVRQLLAAGHRVVALVRDPARAGGLDGAELARGDVTDRASLRAPMQGADGVFHVAGWYKVGAPASERAEGTRINVDGTRNVLETMRDLSIPKGVYTSTLAVYSDTRGRVMDEGYRHQGAHISHYDLTKSQAHEIAEELIGQGLPLVIVQPGVVYGPGDTSALGAAIRNPRLPLAPPARLNWAHVDDVARGHVLAMEKGRVGESYHLAGPAHTVAEALAIRERVAGMPVPRMAPSAATIRALLRIVRAVARVVTLPQSYSPEAMRGVAGTTYLGSNEKARRELGWEPRPLEQGFRETFAASP